MFVMYHTYLLANGIVRETKLDINKFLNRWNRLNTLSDLLNGFDHDIARIIFKKVEVALNKEKGFTGILRLTPGEKMFLKLFLDVNLTALTSKELAVLNYYTRS